MELFRAQLEAHTTFLVHVRPYLSDSSVRSSHPMFLMGTLMRLMAVSLRALELTLV